MDTSEDTHSSVRHGRSHKPPRKLWRLRKILATLLVTVLVFSAGVAVGRNDLHIKGLSIAKSAANSNALDYSSVDQVYGILKDNFDGNLDDAKLIDGLKAGMVGASGDPYTEYFNAEDAKTFNDALSGSFTGIGAELDTDADNNIVIVSPLAGYPAEAAGLKTNDRITAVDGTTTSGMSIDKVVQKIRGPADTDVKLTIVRGGGKPFEVTITRKPITVASVKTEVIGNIGYLKITQFTSDTTKLAKAAVDDFKAKNVKAVILDMRGNPGGYLSGAVDISSLWLDQGKTVVSERHGGRTISTEYAEGGNSLKGLPTVVLIDGGSASASEITAGALHDNGVATIAGDKSFGKGSVQQVKTLPGGSEVKVTVAHWYTPGGKNIDKQGITPDVQVSLSDADKQAGRDPQKDKAIELLKAKL